MLSLAPVGLGSAASAVGTLAIPAYATKEGSKIKANLNNRNTTEQYEMWHAWT